MCRGPVRGNVSSRLCGKDTFTGVTKKALWVRHIKCAIAQCAEMLCGKDTFTGVTKKHCGLETYIKCIIAQCAEMCLHGYVAKTHFIEVVQRKSLISVSKTQI